MIHFDPLTERDWKSRNITEVSVFFYESGCAGTKVRIEEGKSEGMDTTLEQSGTLIHMRSSEEKYLDHGRITSAKGKWIFASDTVNTRCGCGSSFSLQSESPIKDKIARMKLAMKQKKEGVHI